MDGWLVTWPCRAITDGAEPGLPRTRSRRIVRRPVARLSLRGGAAPALAVGERVGAMLGAGAGAGSRAIRVPMVCLPRVPVVWLPRAPAALPARVRSGPRA